MKESINLPELFIQNLSLNKKTIGEEEECWRNFRMSLEEDWGRRIQEGE